MQLTHMQAFNTERAFVAMSSAPPRDQTAKPQAAAWPGGMSAFVREIIASAADVALLLDPAGVIVAAIGDGEAWIGHSFPDVVSPDSRAKAVGLVGDDPASEPAASEINHPGPDGTQRSFRYHRVNDGGSGLRCLIGRDLFRVAALQNRLLEAQQAMEREYARLRLAETRYRVLFHSSPEPIMIADAASLRLIEANPAALAELDLQPDRLGRITLPSLFSPMSGDALETMLASARHSGVAGEVEVSRTGTARKTAIRAIAFRQETAVHLLVRLRRPEADAVALGADASLRHVHGMVEQTPDGCVIMSPDRIVLHANRAFLELAQLASRHQAIGEPLDRWLGRPGIDLPLIQGTLTDHGVIRNFPTIVRGAFGGVEAVELSAVTAWAGDSGSIGLIIRSKGAQAASPPQRGPALPRSVEQLAKLVGNVPLKDIVRETSDVIERLCIESALDLSRNNRAASAQMLGLSRQSFYAKLRRHGLGDLADQDEQL
ncbi:transcriptional regulator PpsR [Bosea sp. (in: a-proteobacteria)]|uniref:transcriptional regulator PpsR n=1 Tax=Bosea sp. (in: a-proteobacteria) TaxID=1871050 RepID=UPI0025C07271|nr:transcriptional regulator PpsR [Bosea sp. (in: a-proteobacteria)]